MIITTEIRLENVPAALDLGFTVEFTDEEGVYQGVIATPAGNPIFLKLIKFMVKIAKSKRKYSYILFTKDFWNNVYKECNMTPIAGVNKNVENINNNYYLAKLDPKKKNRRTKRRSKS